jgi:ethanolamine utilization microcompartment shell protein EutL
MRNAGHEVRFVDTAYCSLDEAAAMATVENVFNQSVLRGVGDKNKNKKASS